MQQGNLPPPWQPNQPQFMVVTYNGCIHTNREKNKYGKNENHSLQAP